MSDDPMRSPFATSPEGDLRFQFDVIRGLSESIRQQSASTERLASGMADMQKTQVGMLERLARLEANKVGEELIDVKGTAAALVIRINALESDKDLRDGGSRAWKGFLAWWGPLTSVLGIIFLVVVFFARAAGILILPENKPVTPIVRVETPGVSERKSE